MAKRRQPLRVFLDSSVLFTAANSPTGGSAKLFTLKNIKLTASRLVLAEVERNVRKKLLIHHLKRFFMLTKKLDIVNQLPNQGLIKEAKKVIAAKDSVILAEAKRSKTDLLATLDRKHFLKSEVENFLKPKRVVTPKMIINEV